MIDPITRYIIEHDYIDEALPLDVAIPLGIVMAVAATLALWYAAGKFMLIGMKKTNKKLATELSNTIKRILNDGRNWNVIIVDDDVNEIAFCYGTTTIFISSKLAERYKDDPRLVEAVLLHEVGHIHHYDSFKKMMILLPGIGIFFAMLLSGAPEKLTIGTIILMFVLFNLHNAYYGKKMELNADSFAVKYGYKQDLIKYFKESKAEEAKIRNKIPRPFRLLYDGLNKLADIMADHPIMEKRIQAILTNKRSETLLTRSTNLKDLTLRFKDILIN